MRVALIILTFLFTMNNFIGCVTMDQADQTIIRNSSLYEDLNSDSRDAMYRAMTYIGRADGPSIDGPPDDLENLQANRQPMIEWLLNLQDPKETLDGYIEFKELWSPIFPD